MADYIVDGDNITKIKKYDKCEVCEANCKLGSILCCYCNPQLQINKLKASKKYFKTEKGKEKNRLYQRQRRVLLKQLKEQLNLKRSINIDDIRKIKPIIDKDDSDSESEDCQFTIESD